MSLYHMYLNDLIFLDRIFLNRDQVENRGFSFKGKGRWPNAS